MNKYELALVLNAKVEDDVRTATLEKVKGLVERFNGTITNVDEWGKKRLAYEIQKMKEGYYYFIQFDADAACPAEGRCRGAARGRDIPCGTERHNPRRRSRPRWPRCPRS